MSNKRFTHEQYADALRRSGGNRAEAAAILGSTLGAVHSMVRFHPDLKALCAPCPTSAGPSPRYRPDQVAEALRQAGGNQTQAARLLGCWKKTVLCYIKRYPEVKAALDASRPRPSSPEQIIAALRQAGRSQGPDGPTAGLDP